MKKEREVGSNEKYSSHGDILNLAEALMHAMPAKHALYQLSYIRLMLMRVYNTTQTLPICLSRVNNLTSPPDFLLNRQTSFFTSSHFPPIQTNKPITCLI